MSTVRVHDTQQAAGFWARNRNVIFLMIAQACFLSCSMTMVTFAGLAGEVLATNKALATLPMSLSIVSTAVSTGPMSMLMQWRSRRFGFRLGALVGILAASIAAYGVYSGSFLALCIGTVSIGPFQASAQYYRFAAAESVVPSRAPRAISLVLVGGLLGALLAPSLTRWFNEVFLPVNMMGAFVFAGVVVAFILLPTTLMRPLEKPFVAEGEMEAEPDVGRPIREIARNPAFIVAVLNGALGYAMMSFVMTATPLAMKACGLIGQSIDVIQGHVIAMFLPSLFTGSLIQRIGLLPVMLMGHACFAVAFITALSGIEIGHFSLALIALGVGWNFCFVGGTTLLTRVHTDAEKGRVQGLNEFLVFGTTAAASLSAGVILQAFGWRLVNQSAFVMLVIAAGATIIWGLSTARKPVAH
ncbi:MFS transporter [Kordiimonas aestuarii]|uniref:MFS transporter n=1 Tax=Kordiimonas aestuarii TaxID=1005925 RepID=UPI0021D2BE11|nr:MFS transporter [Kordiimonas aestuarii]